MLAITNVRVFDARQAILGEPSTVYLYRGKVAAVLPAAKPVAKEATVVDGTGRTLLPALIDVHGHEYDWGAPLHVAGGVTVVRDVGNDNEQFLQLLEKGETSEYMTPRYLGRAGFLEGTSPFASRGSHLGRWRPYDEHLGHSPRRHGHERHRRLLPGRKYTPRSA